MTTENLGPAERIIQTLVPYSDHMAHNRPGLVRPSATEPCGVSWAWCTWKQETTPLGAAKVVYLRTKVGKRENLERVGTLNPDGTVTGSAGQLVGRYQEPGIFPAVAVWIFRQIAEVWKLDNEFAARWASYAFPQEHRDLKVALAAFLLVQSRAGAPVKDGDKVAFFDADFRDVGEAMVLKEDGAAFMDLKMILRVHALLSLPGVTDICRELGFTGTTRRAFLGRFPAVATKWLRYREENPKLLNGLIKKGYRSSLIRLARLVGYKPNSPTFFAALRWKQDQAKDGRRELAIGVAVAAAETWEGLSEVAICERITAERPNVKRIVGLLPASVGLTRAVMSAAIEVGALSAKDLIIYTPTLEDLGLLAVPQVRERWEAAMRAATDQRAANIAKRVTNADTREKLEGAAEQAAKAAIEEVVRGLSIYAIVDISGSMEGSIERAKEYLTKLLPAFPLEKLHVSVFNTSGREIAIPHASAAGVANAFRGITAGGGTDYGQGVLALRGHRPDALEDSLFIFFGDEVAAAFGAAVLASGLRPAALALVPVTSARYGRGHAVRSTAVDLGIPFFEIDEQIFSDPYAVPRTLRALIAATPVRAVVPAQAAVRVSLAETILKTELLQKPAWA